MAAPLHPDVPFVIRDSRGMMLFLGSVSVGAGLLMLYQADGESFRGFSFYLLQAVVLTLVIVCFYRAAKQKMIFLVDRRGIFYYGKLITDWDHFEDAQVKEELTGGRQMTDNFMLHVRFHREGGLYKRSFPLANTFDKADEELVAAIRFFRDRHLEQSGRPTGD